MILDWLFKKKSDKKSDKDTNLSFEPKHSNNPSVASVSNAQSWNTETHPEGMGPSHLVQDIDYDNISRKMDVTYRDGFTAEYDGIDSSQAKSFIQADSKGRWALKNLWNLPYKEI